MQLFDSKIDDAISKKTSDSTISSSSIVSSNINMSSNIKNNNNFNIKNSLQTSITSDTDSIGVVEFDNDVKFPIVINNNSGNNLTNTSSSNLNNVLNTTNQLFP